jgi:serine/tyrosine/threonine adenylyltransferase
MLEALGVETSKSFSLVETGEALERNDEPSPTRSAVLVRLQHSHIRIGTFQRLAYFQDTENLTKLTDYCLRHYFGDPGGGDGPARLLAHVAREAARLAASYIAAGFVHGVLNSDNIAITAQSFDYGPWRFTPFWDGHFTAAYFDHAGLYSFGRQPEAIHWDLVQLALSLRTIAEADALTPRLETFPHLFQQALRDALFARIGIRPGELDADMRVVTAIEEALAQKTVEIDRFFFDWRGGRLREGGPAPAPRSGSGSGSGSGSAPAPAPAPAPGPGSALSPAPSEESHDPSYKTAPSYKTEAFETLAGLLRRRAISPGALDHPYWSDPAPCSMHIDEVEAIWAAIDERDDWAPLHAKIAAIRRMGEALHANA